MIKQIGLLSCICAVLLFGGNIEAKQSGVPEPALRDLVKTYVDAYNKSDAAAMAAMWSRDGEFLLPTGERFKGPDKIRPALEKVFEGKKGGTATAELFDIQQENQNKALVKGIAEFAEPDETPKAMMFTASLIKEKNNWKILKISEEELSVPVKTIAELGKLEWLIGEWVDQDENVSIESSFQWAPGYAYIVGHFKVVGETGIEMEGTQIIGWDPVQKKLRSWIFDSHAGQGEGEWSNNGDQWTVKTKMVLNDGKKASAVNIYSPVDSNSFTWQSIGREVQGDLLPNIPEVTVVRKNTVTAEKKQGK